MSDSRFVFMGERGFGVGGGGGAKGEGAALGEREPSFWDVVVGGAEAVVEGSSIFRGESGAESVFSAGLLSWRTAFRPLPREDDEEATIVMLRPFHLYVDWPGTLVEERRHASRLRRKDRPSSEAPISPSLGEWVEGGGC